MIRFRNRHDLENRILAASEAANELWEYADVDEMPLELWSGTVSAYLSARGDPIKAAQRAYRRIWPSVRDR